MTVPLNANECQARINSIIQTPVTGTVSSFRPRLIPNPNPPPVPVPPPRRRLDDPPLCPHCSLTCAAVGRGCEMTGVLCPKMRAKRHILKHQQRWRNKSKTQVLRNPHGRELMSCGRAGLDRTKEKSPEEVNYVRAMVELKRRARQ